MWLRGGFEEILLWVTQKASLGAITVARSVGHIVATAHMADHSLVAVLYALKAAKNVGKSAVEETSRQNKKLPSDIKELVLTARKFKNI